MVIRSIWRVAIITMALSLLGCGSSPKPKRATATVEPRPISVVKNDLQKRLTADDRLQGSKIGFDYDGMTVILHGTVKDKDQFGWAATVAAGTPGVKGVINRLQVEVSAPEAETPKVPGEPRQIPRTQAPEAQSPQANAFPATSRP